VVAKHGALGLAGAAYGKDVILSNDILRDLGDAIALTFCQTISLSQQDIFALLPEYPKAFYVIRKAALSIALTRALVMAAKLIRRSGSKSGEDKRSLIEIFDQALRESNEAARANKATKAQESANPIPISRKTDDVIVARDEGVTKASAAIAAMLAGGPVLRAPVMGKGKWGKLGVKINAGEIPEMKRQAEHLETHSIVAATIEALADDVPRLGVEAFASKAKTRLEDAKEQIVKLGQLTVETHKAEMEASTQFEDRLAALELTMQAVMVEMRSRVNVRQVRQRRPRSQTIGHLFDHVQTKPLVGVEGHGEVQGTGVPEPEPGTGAGHGSRPGEGIGAGINPTPARLRQEQARLQGYIG